MLRWTDGIHETTTPLPTRSREKFREVAELTSGAELAIADLTEVPVPLIICAGLQARRALQPPDVRIRGCLTSMGNSGLNQDRSMRAGLAGRTSSAVRAPMSAIAVASREARLIASV